MAAGADQSTRTAATSRFAAPRLSVSRVSPGFSTRSMMVAGCHSDGGGSAADYIVDLLGRDYDGYFNNPVGERYPFTSPANGIWGPKVMIINEMAGSGGDPGSRFSAALLQQPDIADDHAAIDGLAHVVNRQQSGTGAA